MKPLLGIPPELSVLDIMCFGPPAKPPYKRWKKPLADISNWNRFDASHFMTEAQIDEWVATTRHKGMYRDPKTADKGRRRSGRSRRAGLQAGRSGWIPAPSRLSARVIQSRRADRALRTDGPPICDAGPP